MGATDSKLQFKTHVFRLFEEPNIAADDPYWLKFWEQPESASDIFTLLTASDIRSTRDLHIENLETLLLAVTSRLFYLYNHEAFPSVEQAPAKELLNCIRLLTRIMPFIYEKNDHRMQEWEDRFFWGKRRVRVGTNEEDFEEAPALAERLIETGLGLLFYSGLTIPRTGGDGSNNSNNNSNSEEKSNSNDKVVYSIWETGVGCSTPMTTTHELQANRVEIVRFLLALFSDCLYDSPNSFATEGSRYLTYTVTRQNKRSTMSVLCSLLNVTLKYYPGWKVPYDHMIISDRHRQLVTYSLQLLELLLVYLVPGAARNWYRHYLSKIHRAQDLQFIADSLAKLLTQPIQASTSYLPGSRREIEWICELTMLFWDLMQCNKKFKAYLISSNRVHDFTVLLQYYIHDKGGDSSKQGFVRLCAYVLLDLSSDETYAKSLSKRFEGQSSLPAAIKLNSFSGTYADYLIIQLLKSISNSGESLDYMVATLLDVIFNISPHVVDISYLAASNFVHLLVSLSSPSFFMANERNQYVLGTLLQTFSLLVDCNFHSNSNLVFVLVRNLKPLDALRKAIQSQIGKTDDNDESSPSGDAKGKGKSKQKTSASSDAINRLSDIWVILDPLIMKIEAVKRAIQFPDDPSNRTAGTNFEPHAVTDTISRLNDLPGYNLQPTAPTEEQFEPIHFYWNPSSLGWYESVLWGSIFQHEHAVGSSATITDAAAAGIVNQNAATNVGVWNGTDIKLFKLQEVAPSGPTFMQPKGAVDALADSMIQKFGQFTNRNEQ